MGLRMTRITGGWPVVCSRNRWATGRMWFRLPAAAFLALVLCGCARSAMAAERPASPATPVLGRAAADAARLGLPADTGVVWYAVPALSGTRRTPEVYPDDGVCRGPVEIVAAKGEFESASFQLVAFQEYAGVEIEVGDLAGPNGTIPASALDVKVVKVWVQTGAAWNSYSALFSAFDCQDV